jgi:hypothetical protein
VAAGRSLRAPRRGNDYLAMTDVLSLAAVVAAFIALQFAAQDWKKRDK